MTTPARVLVCCALLGGVAVSASAAPPSAAVIVANERAFEQAAIERGSRAAFLEFLAADALLLEPQPVPGRASVEQGPSPGAPLRWRPDVATISSAGDFGWASGPFLAYARSTDEPPVASGHYFTVWRREPDAGWRVLLDGGIAYPVSAEQRPAQLSVTPRLRAATSGRGRSAGCAAKFAARWRAAGRAAALGDYLAADARLLISGRAPLDGRAQIVAHDPLAGAVLSATRPLQSLAAAGGDLLVSVGELELESAAAGSARRYVHLEAWDLGQSCRLALEMLDPQK